jgi:DNA helicase IV
MAHPDLPAEQAHVDRAYERLEEIRAEVQAQLKEAYRERGGTFQSYTERDIRVRNSLSRLDQLQLGREALVFGRIDRAGPPGEAPAAKSAESYHIGRLAISDRDHEPLVVDWRAPVAEPFYRATGAHPMGLKLRRHFLTEGRRVLDLEDEVFSPEGTTTGAELLGLSGPTVLLAALERAHTGRMRDIVATVQAEQDEIIRAPLQGVLVVQGGPGTGKTAVALHRAAYLLYTYRFPLESQGVLVVGPNPTFLRYIDQVLPSLGETGVELSTASGLYKHARPSLAEPPELARLKGDPRMAQFILRAVRQRQRPLRRTVRVPYGGTTLVLEPEASSQIVTAAKRRPGTHNGRRRLVESLLWQHFAGQLASRSPEGSTATAPSAAELGAELRRLPEVAEVLERSWPRLSAEQLVHDLLGAKPLIEQAGRGLLSSEEMELLYRPRSESYREAPWSQADIALLDEASWLLGPPRPVKSPPGGRGGQVERAYGHIVVDEAQDLSPMELRMLARRSLSGSMTVVGDIAQATGAWAPSSWEEVASYLPTRKGWRQVSLSVSYRAPAEVMKLAAAVLAAALPSTSPPEPVRRTGEEPRFVDASAKGAGLGEVVGLVVGEEVAALARPRGAEAGSVGVLVPSSLYPEARSGLVEAGIAFGEVGAGALDMQVSLLTLADAKGLEFDSVVVVEPARIVSSSPQGMRALYVALTRCTRRLSVIYREPLPAPLAGCLPGAPAPKRPRP